MKRPGILPLLALLVLGVALPVWAQHGGGGHGGGGGHAGGGFAGHAGGSGPAMHSGFSASGPGHAMAPPRSGFAPRPGYGYGVRPGYPPGRSGYAPQVIGGGVRSSRGANGGTQQAQGDRRRGPYRQPYRSPYGYGYGYGAGGYVNPLYFAYPDGYGYGYDDNDTDPGNAGYDNGYDAQPPDDQAYGWPQEPYGPDPNGPDPYGQDPNGQGGYPGGYGPGDYGQGQPGGNESPQPNAGQGASSAPQSRATPEVVNVAPPESAVTLIFKDGRAPLHFHNYILSRSSLSVLDGPRRVIPVDQIDVAATERANRAAGVDFELPAR